MDADATENIPEVQAELSSESPGAGTLSDVEFQLKDEVNGGQTVGESMTPGAPLSSPRVTKTYGRRKSRGMVGSGVSTPTPTSSRLGRTRSSSALQAAASKPRKRGRSPSPSSSKPSKAPKLPSKATVKRASSTSDLKEPKQPRVPSKPLKQKASTKPVQGLLRTGTGLGIDSDSELSELTSLSRSRSPVSEIEFVGNSKPIPPLLPPLIPSSQLSSKAHSSLSRPKALHIPRPNPQPTFEDRPSSYVWVLIDPTTGTVQDDRQERLWWPGKIMSKKNTDVPLKVLLFGRNKTITISESNNDVVRSKDNALGKRRFSEPTYVDGMQTEGRESPKRETGARIEVARKWRDAVIEMDQDDNQSNSDDDMPEVYQMFVPSHRSTVSTSTVPLSEPPDEPATSDSSALPQMNDKGRGKRKKLDPYHNERDLVDEPDELLTIPGEMVFGREKKCSVGIDPATTIEFWAAKILSFHPPEGKQKYALYGVTWMTGESGKIPRSWFYSLGEDEFFTCRLGAIDSSGGAAEEDDISDTDFSRRSPSPGPQSDPPTGIDFLHLPIRQQFVYTKPVLSAILKNEYAPLKELQAEYFSRKSKRDWSKRGSRRGPVTDGQANSLLVYLKEWLLRERKTDQGPEKEVDSLEDDLEHSFEAPGRDADGAARDEVPAAKDDEARQEATNHDDQSQVEPLKPVEDMQVEESEQQDQISDAERNPETDVLSEPNDRSRSSSPPMTEAAPSSPPAFPPPSSLPSIPSRQASFSLDGPTADVDEIMTTALDTVTEELSNEPSAQCEEAPVDDKMVVDGDDTACLDALPLQNPGPIVSVVGTPPRQQGSPEYEALLPLKKIHYMADFLLVELIRQILLWRSGDRTSYELLSDEKELQLFELGEEKLETDWVHQIMALRENRAVAPVPSVTVTSSGKVLRGRKNGISYAE